MKISLIIPAYNEEKYLPICLASVIDNAPNSFCEIIVVDNGSTDKTKEVAGRFPGVKVVSEPRKGLTSARQRGLETAQGDLLAYIDADTKMPKGWPEKVQMFFSRNPKIVCLSGPYVYYDAALPTRISNWLYWHILAYPTYWLTGYMVVGGNFAAKKSALLQINGFDRTISFYGEDTDIAKRLHRVGKVKFTTQLYMRTSARRFKGEGTVATALLYVLNFFSVAFLGRPVSKDYKDIR